MRSVTPNKISLLCLTLLGACSLAAAQSVIFSESMGTVSGTTAISTHNTNNGFDNDTFTFSGTGDIRATTTSSGYAGASESANVFLTNNGTAFFQISGIDTTNYTPGSLNLSFGAFKSAIASDMTELAVSWSLNGTDFTSLAIPAQPTGSGTAVWRLVSITGTAIPITSTLSLRFQNTSTTPQFRIDDVTLSGSPIPEPSAFAMLLGLMALVGVGCRRPRRAQNLRK